MKIYCRICEEETQHTFRGLQRGAKGRTLELYDCLSCRDTCRDDKHLFIDIPENSLMAQQFKENHYHLWRWMNSGLGREYLNKQIEKGY